MASVRGKLYFIVPQERSHWGDSLLPWVLASALLMAALVYFFVHIAKPQHVRLPAKEANKTFQIMPEPIQGRAPRTAHKVVPPKVVEQTPAHPRTQPHQPLPHPRTKASPRPIPPHPLAAHPPRIQENQTTRSGKASPAPAPAAPSSPASPPRIDLGRLETQMDQAAREATASPPLPKFENPKGPVADFYIAGWIQKLERIGDLNYPGEMTGNLKVRVILNQDGGLNRIIIEQSSGKPALDAAAERIIRLSFPYTPFSKQLAAQTRKIEIPLNMHFLGARNVSAW